MELLIAFAIGIIIGGVAANVIFRLHKVGSLRIDNSDINNRPYLFLELTHDVSDIYKHKYVLMNVNAEGYISQK